jgi:hypothetical protein
MNTQNMNTHELLEMASLDALGLLDPEERESFERSFRAADPAVQAQIRREQLRFSSVDDMLPQVAPPLGLKARVIAAMRDAMQNMAGRRHEAAPPLQLSSGISRFWRVGAIGAMAATIVIGVYALQVANENSGLTDARQGILMSEHWQKEFGHRFEANFLNPSTHFVSFHPAVDAPDAKGARATLMFDPSKKTAQLVVQDLPSAGDYEVVVVDAQGNQGSAVITFKSSGNGKKSEIINGFNAENAKQLLIRVQGSDKPVLQSNGI